MLPLRQVKERRRGEDPILDDSAPLLCFQDAYLRPCFKGREKVQRGKDTCSVTHSCQGAEPAQELVACFSLPRPWCRIRAACCSLQPPGGGWARCGWPWAGPGQGCRKPLVLVAGDEADRTWGQHCAWASCQSCQHHVAFCRLFPLPDLTQP